MKATAFAKKLSRWRLLSAIFSVIYWVRGYPEVIVVSGGGAGTTVLIRAISNYRRVNREDDLDALKHRVKFPQRAVRAGTRIVYVRPAGSRQIQSLARRGTLRFQAFKMGGYRGLVVSPNRLEEFLRERITAQEAEFLRVAGDNVLITSFPDFLMDPTPIEIFLGLEDTDFRALMPRYRGPNGVGSV